jgi:predicted nicotinamide N-methyase
MPSGAAPSRNHGLAYLASPLSCGLSASFKADLDCRHRQACVALSNHLLADPTLVLTHKRIIELGAGVGLLSLVSAKLSAGGAAPEIEGAEPRIVATDVDEKVLEMLQANIAESKSSFLRQSFHQPQLA